MGTIGSITWLLYIVGHNKPWAIHTEDKVIEWGKRLLEKEKSGDKQTKHRFIWIGIIILIYVVSILPDLILDRYVNTYYSAKLSGVKNVFQSVEVMLSKGYEKYPPLFLFEEKWEPAIQEETDIAEERMETYIQLNSKGEQGANIRIMPNLESEIVGGVKMGSMILYKMKWNMTENDIG